MKPRRLPPWNLSVQLEPPAEREHHEDCPILCNAGDECECAEVLDRLAMEAAEERNDAEREG